MDIKERLEKCYQMCELISAAEVSDSANRNLKSLLRLDLINFCVYLAFADQVMSPQEEAYIRESFSYPLNWANRADALAQLNQAEGFPNKIPTAI